MAASTGRESDKFIVRLPQGMRDRIKLAADGNNRSMNAEIVAALEDKYPAPKIMHLPDMSVHIRQLRKEAGENPKKLAEVEALENDVATIIGLIEVARSRND